MFSKAGRRAAGNHGSLSVTALLNQPMEKEIWVWDLLARVRPQLGELIAMTDTSLVCPEFDKALLRSFRLRSVTESRDRVVLVAAAPAEDRHLEITRWHVRSDKIIQSLPLVDWTSPFGTLSVAPVTQCVPGTPCGEVPLLPFWLDDELPAEGLDFIQIPWPRSAKVAAPGSGLEDAAAWTDPTRADSIEFVGPHAAALRVTCSALLGILWQIVREVGSRSARVGRAA